MEGTPKHHRNAAVLRVTMGRVAPGGSSPGESAFFLWLDSQARIETHQNTVVNVRDGSKASFWLPSRHLRARKCWNVLPVVCAKYVPCIVQARDHNHAQSADIVGWGQSVRDHDR